MSEWIEHDGKSIPGLPRETLIHVKWEDGTLWENENGTLSLPLSDYMPFFLWDEGDKVKLLAYKVVTK